MKNFYSTLSMLKFIRTSANTKALTCAYILGYLLSDTKHEVKTARYWPSSFFWTSMDQDRVEVHKLTKKSDQYPAILVNEGFNIKIWLHSRPQRPRSFWSVTGIRVLNGFVNTIDRDQNQSHFSDSALSMRRVMGSP